MDALPIQEQSQHEFVSQNKGVAHMCGHDVHMAVALLAAKLIVDNQSNIKSNVRFLFQPSEELPPGGAIGMIEQGALEADAFYLTITGCGGHAARPQDCLDPIIAAAQLVTNWQAIIARRINPTHPVVLSVTQIQAGDTFNVIPDCAKLAGTIRTYVEDDRKLIVDAMQAQLASLKQAGYQCKFDYVPGYACVINHAAGVDRIQQAANQILPKENVDIQTEPEGWAEDFAYYLQHRPGAFFILGSGNREQGISAPLHSANFNVDENAIPIGAAILAQIVYETSSITLI